MLPRLVGSGVSPIFLADTMPATHWDHEPADRAIAVLDCASPLALSVVSPALPKRQGTGAVQNLTAPQTVHGLNLHVRPATHHRAGETPALPGQVHGKPSSAFAHALGPRTRAAK